MTEKTESAAAVTDRVAKVGVSTFPSGLKA